MKKRILALFLTGMLSLSVTACGGADSGAAKTDAPATAADTAVSEEAEVETEAESEESEAEEVDAFAAAVENTRSVESMEMQMVMDMEMEATQDGEQQSFASTITMDMTCFSDPWKIKMDMSVDAGEAGSMDNMMSIYGEVAEDGTATMYLHDGESDTWQSQVVGNADLEQYDASANMLAYIDNGITYELEGMEEVNVANAYKYAHTMSGEEAKEAILTSGALDSLTSAGVDQAQVEAELSDVRDLTEYVWIDEASLYPVKYELDMSEAMNTLMASIVKSMGEEAEGMEMAIPKMVVTMNCSNFNSAEDFTIPEEAKNS